MLFDLALAEGGQVAGNAIQLPPSLGRGFVRFVEPEPGLKIAIHHYVLAREITVKRVAGDAQSETLLISFNAFDPAPGAATWHLSSVHISSSDVGATFTLPAQTTIFIIGFALEKVLVRSWLNAAEEPAPAILTTDHTLVFDTLMTPEIQRSVLQLAEAPPSHYLASFFYRIRTQELVYLLFVELAKRATVPPRHLHATDAEKIFQVRAALLSSLNKPPSLPALAKTAGLGETKMKQLFRQVFGTSIYDYFQLARMEEAKRLLRHLSVSEVGYQLGFTNLSHFARLFEKHHQLTPKKYQATLR